MDDSKIVWNIPVVTEEKTVIVQVSPKVEDDEIRGAISLNREISYTSLNEKSREIENVTLEKAKLSQRKLI